MEIRKATLGDSETLASICAADGLDHPFGKIPANHYLEIMNAGETIFIAEIDGNAVGYASLNPNLDGKAELRFLSVKREHHRQGIGSALVGMIEAEAKRIGKKEVCLFVLQKNTRAQSFYLQNNYLVSGFFADKYCAGEHGIIMIKTLV